MIDEDRFPKDILDEADDDAEEATEENKEGNNE